MSGRSHFAPSENQKRAWLQLIRSENVGPHTFRTLVNRYGSAEKALERLPELSAKGGLKRKIKIYPVERAERELEQAASLGAHLILMGEKHYPSLLAETYAAPPALFVMGQVEALSRPSVAIVGSRKSSALGVEMASQLADGLSQNHIQVVSGLARGVDGAAHRASLHFGTVAVIAGGPDNIYPPEHADLAEKIKETGAILCEEGPGYQTRAQDFPRRNRIIAGMSLGVIVVEAALRSGSLITARQALEENRQVFAVPGSPLDPRAAGTNKLIRDGALLVRSVEDILEDLPSYRQKQDQLDAFSENQSDISPRIEASSETSEILDPDEDDRARVRSSLSVSPIEIDKLARLTNLAVGPLQGVLLEMELAGQLCRHPGQRVSLKPAQRF